MPGAGSSTAAYALEQDYNGSIIGPTYYNLGSNVTFDTIELDRNLLEQSLPGRVQDADALAQRIDGQLSVSAVLNTDHWHNLVFNKSGNTSFTSGRVPSATWYEGVTLPGGTDIEREISGWAPQSATVQYNGTTEAVRVTLTGFYAEETGNNSLTPGSIQNLTTGDEVPGHGATFDVDGSTVSRLQEATLSFDNIGRPQFDSDNNIAVDAVAGNVEQSCSMTATVTNTDRLEYVYGSSGASTIEEFVNAVPLELTFSHGNTTVASYTFDTAKPRNYSWNDLVNDDADLSESVEWWATNISASAP